LFGSLLFVSQVLTSANDVELTLDLSLFFVLRMGFCCFMP